MGSFLQTLLNPTSDTHKLVEDKDIRFFMHYMDLDRNQTVSKGEFLKYFSKVEVIANKLYPLYREYEERGRAKMSTKVD